MPPNSTTPPVVWPCACRLFKAPSKHQALAAEVVQTLKTGHSPPGWTNAPHTSRDPDLAPLRDRDDFRRPPAELFDRGFPAHPLKLPTRGRGAGKEKGGGEVMLTPALEAVGNLGLLSGPHNLRSLVERSQGEVAGGRADGRLSPKGSDGQVGGRAIRSVSRPEESEP